MRTLVNGERRWRPSGARRAALAVSARAQYCEHVRPLVARAALRAAARTHIDLCSVPCALCPVPVLEPDSRVALRNII
ncbi:unnamed protein product [Colias eurytheme]|nr:unnamed protein product [Colias eurytheme]